MRRTTARCRVGILGALVLLASSCQETEPSPLELNGPPASLAILSGDGQTGPSGTALAQALTVLVRDQAGQAVPAVQVSWSATGGTLSAAVDSTDDDGQSSVQWTMPDAPGNYVVRATVSGLATVSFTGRASPGLPFSVTIVAGSGQTVEAGQAADLVVYVGDQTGLPVPGVVVKWSTTNGRLSAPTSSTASDGKASIRWTLPEAPGTYQAVGEVAGLSTATFTVTVSGLPSTLSIVSGDNQKNVTGTLLQPMVVVVRDKAGKPVRSIPVVWETTGGQLTRPVDSTGIDGTASTQLTLPGTAGTYQVTATVEGLAPVQFTVTAVNPLIFRYLDAGSYHSCGITTSEELYCWGYNGDGQAGGGAGPSILLPQKVERVERFRAVSGGRYHTCGITLSGEVVCWGASRDGRTSGGGLATYRYLNAGELFSCGISLRNQVWCWGYNREGELGQGFVSDQAAADTTSTPIGWTGTLPPEYTSVAVGAMHACGIVQPRGALSGTAYCWGYGRDGQLGVGPLPFPNVAPDSLPDRKMFPNPVTGTAGFLADTFRVVPRPPDPAFPLPAGPFIAAGFAHSCGIAAGSGLLCWGLNERGQFGNGTRVGSVTPVQVATPAPFARITAGNSHTCGLTSQGAVYCWGDNTYGQLGDSTYTDRTVPTLVRGTGPGGLVFAYVKAGELTTCGLTSTGVGYCWGDNEYGQLGDGTTQSSSIPRKVAFQPTQP